MRSYRRTSLLCPGCRKLISADELSCPHCGLSRPGNRRHIFTNFLNVSGDITRIIIYINIGMYALSLILSLSDLHISPNPFSFLSPSQEGLFILGATGTIPLFGFGRWWTLIAASYLHGGLLHIFFNMLALSQLGPFVQREFGSYLYIILYSISSVAGFMLSTWAGVPFTIGASAGICGLIGAILYYGKARGGSYGQSIYSQASGWVVGLVIYGLLVPGINNWAHGGGLICGIILARILRYQEYSKDTAIHKIIAVFCIIMTAVSIFLGLLHIVIRYR
jgi:rhomboid protease GluP